MQYKVYKIRIGFKWNSQRTIENRSTSTQTQYNNACETARVARRSNNYQQYSIFGPKEGQHKKRTVSISTTIKENRWIVVQQNNDKTMKKIEKNVLNVEKCMNCVNVCGKEVYKHIGDCIHAIKRYTNTTQQGTIILYKKDKKNRSIYSRSYWISIKKMFKSIVVTWKCMEIIQFVYHIIQNA